MNAKVLVLIFLLGFVVEYPIYSLDFEMTASN